MSRDLLARRVLTQDRRLHLPVRSNCLLGGTPEEVADFGIFKLVEAFVPLSNGHQKRWNFENDHLIRLGANEGVPFIRGHRYSDDDRFCACVADRTHRGNHCGARCDAVIRQYHGFSGEIERRPTSPINVFPTLELQTLLLS